jgi:arginyl-tRNA synthetase
MNDTLATAITQAVSELFAVSVTIELSRPDEQFGDFATNVALHLSKQLGQNPRTIAESLQTELLSSLAAWVSDVAIAGPGFLNFRLTDAALLGMMQPTIPSNWRGQVVVAEYSDPNPFKVLHAGHLYTSLVGDAVANLLELSGAVVHRVNFGGDVGLHVGKTMWAIIQELGGELPEKLAAIMPDQRLEWVSQCYVTGNEAYETDEQAKHAIVAYNKQVYALHAANDTTSPFAQIYWTCRQWSYDGFDELYERLEMKPFEKYYPESEVADLGLATVKSHTGVVYELSDGAVIFRGEPFGLFTQVFINGEGLPTYAAKDVGLIQHKFQDYHYDGSFIITDSSQKDHLSVVMKSVEQYEPELVARTIHKTHGRIKLAGGVKMSSRTGNILSASTILDTTTQANRAARGNEDDQSSTIVGAVRYSFLKNRIGSDIVYDPSESVSLEGNSGPYLQYAHARARSILRKADQPTTMSMAGTLEPAERSLARKISEYSEVLGRAVDELMPHHICGYLYELAQEFNRFYEHNRVIDDPRQATRLSLIDRYATTLESGLGLLGIAAPHQM